MGGRVFGGFRIHTGPTYNPGAWRGGPLSPVFRAQAQVGGWLGIAQAVVRQVDRTATGIKHIATGEYDIRTGQHHSNGAPAGVHPNGRNDGDPVRGGSAVQRGADIAGIDLSHGRQDGDHVDSRPQRRAGYDPNHPDLGPSRDAPPSSPAVVTPAASGTTAQALHADTVPAPIRTIDPNTAIGGATPNATTSAPVTTVTTAAPTSTATTRTSAFDVKSLTTDQVLTAGELTKMTAAGISFNGARIGQDPTAPQLLVDKSGKIQGGYTVVSQGNAHHDTIYKFYTREDLEARFTPEKVASTEQVLNSVPPAGMSARAEVSAPAPVQVAAAPSVAPPLKM